MLLARAAFYPTLRGPTSASGRFRVLDAVNEVGRQVVYAALSDPDGAEK
jgi:hypothetical protein